MSFWVKIFLKILRNLSEEHGPVGNTNHTHGVAMDFFTTNGDESALELVVGLESSLLAVEKTWGIYRLHLLHPVIVSS